MERSWPESSQETASRRDLIALSNGSYRSPELKKILETMDAELLRRLYEEAGHSGRSAPAHRPGHCGRSPFSVREGGMIKPGYNEGG